MYASVVTEEADGVLVITLNRPEVRNSVDAATAQAAAAAFERLDAQPHLRVAILTGAGGNFCSGMDLKAFVRGESPRVEPRGFIGLNEHTFAKPIIAAVEGYALAGGLEAALACDQVVASRSARFGIPEVKRGLAATSGGLYRLPRKIPMNVAMEMALTGEPITGERAAQLGLVNRITEPGEALAEAGRLAAQIAANGPLAVAASKAVVLRQQDWLLSEIVERQREVAGHVIKSDDAKEGARAFYEKRKPQWRGC